MQKYANLVDREKCCQTHIFLQKFVLIQLRTSPRKNCNKLEMFANFLDLALLAARERLLDKLLESVVEERHVFHELPLPRDDLKG